MVTYYDELTKEDFVARLCYNCDKHLCEGPNDIFSKNCPAKNPFYDPELEKDLSKFSEAIRRLGSNIDDLKKEMEAIRSTVNKLAYIIGCIDSLSPGGIE